MADKLSTTTQQAIDNVLFDLVASQRTFSNNYGEAIPSLRRSLIQQVTIMTAAVSTRSLCSSVLVVGSSRTDAWRQACPRVNRALPMGRFARAPGERRRVAHEP